MTTRNDCLCFKDKQKSGANDISHKSDCHDQYSNFSLNKNRNCLSLIPVQSCAKPCQDKHYDSSISDNYEEKGMLKAFNKSNVLCSNTLKPDVQVQEKAGKQWKKDNSSSNVSKSTLSLHIAAFENSVEAAAFDATKKWGNKKPLFIASTFVIQDPFEFPRQENDKVTEPEVSQFRVSRRLFNLNEAPTNGQQNVPIVQQPQFPSQNVRQPLSSVTGMQRPPLQQEANFTSGSSTMLRRSKRLSSSQTPSPKKPSPIKKLLLRRTSQTPERSIYQIVQTPTTTKTFLEESYDETTPSPPLIERKEDKHQRYSRGNGFKSFAEPTKTYNAFGLEESADNESEMDEKEEEMRVSKKKKKTLKKSRKPKVPSPDFFVDLNNEIIASGLEGIGTIEAVTSLLDQSFTSHIRKGKRTSKAHESPLTLTNDKSARNETKMDVEEHASVDIDMIDQDDYIAQASTSKLRRSSRSEMVMPKLSPMILPKAQARESVVLNPKEPKSSMKNEKQKEVVAISEDSFEIIIEESAVKSTVVEELTNLKIEDNVKGVEGDTVSALDVNKTVEKMSKSKSNLKKKATPRNSISEKTSTASLNPIVAEEMISVKSMNKVGTVKEERMDTVSNVAMNEDDTKPEPKPVAKAKKNQKTNENPSPKPLLNHQHSFNTDMEVENIKPQISLSKHKSPLPSTSNVKQKNDGKINPPIISPFTFTPEQLERLKSQQLPPHQPIPKGTVAVKLVPQNRSSAPAFIQIPPKDFRRMLPKLPQMPPKNNEKL